MNNNINLKVESYSFGDEDWIVINNGLGDTINQILYLESKCNFSYGIICRKRNLDFVLFITKLLFNNKESKFNKKIISYENPEHGFFVDYDIVYFDEDINKYSGNGKFKTVHGWPNEWHKYLNKNIVNDLNSKLSDKKSLEKKILFFTERADGYGMSDDFWNTISKLTISLGYENYTNITTKEVYPGEKNIIDSTPLVLNFQELFDFVNENNVVLIGQRSGIFDFLKYFSNKKIIFYPDQPDWLWNHSNFKNDIFAKNTFDFYNKFSLNEIVKILGESK